MSYSPGAKNGTLILGGMGPGINSTQLNQPLSLYYDLFSNSLLIGNLGAHTIVRYVLGGTNWTLAAGNSNGTFGSSSTSLNSPTSAIFDPMGNMYVSDWGNNRIQFFPAGGMNGTTIAGITGVSGTNATTLYGPWSVRLDNQLNLYVVDELNHRVQKFLRY